MPYTVTDKTRLTAIRTARDLLPEAERAMIDDHLARLQEIKGVGEVAALEVLAALGVAMAEREAGGLLINSE